MSLLPLLLPGLLALAPAPAEGKEVPVTPERLAGVYRLEERGKGLPAGPADKLTRFEYARDGKYAVRVGGEILSRGTWTVKDGILTVESRDCSHDVMVDQMAAAIAGRLVP